MNRRLTAYSLLLTAILISNMFLGNHSAQAAGATLSVSPASGTFNKGCTFTVDVLMNTGGAQTDGTDAILFYDSTRFKAETVKSGTVYSDYSGNIIDPQEGKITISGLSSMSSTFSGSGTLATINFSVLEDAPEGASQLTFDFDPNDKGKTIDSNVVERGTASDILSSVINGNYTIGDGACSSTGVVTPTTVRGTALGQGGVDDGTTKPIPDTLPKGGSLDGPVMLGVMGGVLVVLGILGLVLL